MPKREKSSYEKMSISESLKCMTLNTWAKIEFI